MVFVFSIDQAFVQHFYVTLESLIATNGRNITVYIINGGVIEESKRNILDYFGNKLIKIAFLDVNLDMYANFLVSRHVSRSTYYRISIPDIVPSNLDKVIYLDCDIIVIKPLNDLWNVDMGNCSVAAVPEYSNSRNIEMGLGNTLTFNAGVLLMNLKKWRELKLSKKIIDYISANPDKIKFWDQDALNAVLVNDWVCLSEKWNFTVDYLKNKKFKRKNIAIVHFNQSFKPWHYRLNHPYKKLYYKYLELTPFKSYTPVDRNAYTIFTKVIRKLILLFLYR